MLDFLIPEMWIQGEAVDRGVHVTHKQVERSYEQERKSANPLARDRRGAADVPRGVRGRRSPT